MPGARLIELRLLSCMFTFVLAIVFVGTSACSSHTDSKSSSGGAQGGAVGESISRDDAISNHWDDIREYLNGSQTVEACSSESR